MGSVSLYLVKPGQIDPPTFSGTERRLTVFRSGLAQRQVLCGILGAIQSHQRSRCGYGELEIIFSIQWIIHRDIVSHVAQLVERLTPEVVNARVRNSAALDIYESSDGGVLWPVAEAVASWSQWAGWTLPHKLVRKTFARSQRRSKESITSIQTGEEEDW